MEYQWKCRNLDTILIYQNKWENPYENHFITFYASIEKSLIFTVFNIKNVIISYTIN